MWRRACLGSVILGLAFCTLSPTRAAAQTTTAVDELAPPGSPFALAMARWEADFDSSVLGRHLAAQPADSAAHAAAWARFGDGDMTVGDDAALLNFFAVSLAAVEAAPADLCQRPASSADNFFGLMAAADSAMAVRWVDAIERIVLSALVSGPRSPAADEVAFDAAMRATLESLPEEEELVQWVRLGEAGDNATPVQQCESAHLLFRLYARMPEPMRIGVIRATMTPAAE